MGKIYLCSVTMHEKYMHRCLNLAQMGWPMARPNPMVGSVIVHDGKIIGEGYHQKYGEPHAEVNAINSIDNQSLLSQATLYVNLEPCSHHGKTPPCANLIIEKGIKNVVIGTSDPFAKVAGEGIKKLKAAGVNVTLGILEKECLELNKRFFTFHEKKRPYIILKWAESQDGFLDQFRENSDQPPAKISGHLSHQISHQLRANEAAILVGGNTWRLDQPSLNTRLVNGCSPIRIFSFFYNNINANNQQFDFNQQNLIFNTEASNKKETTEWIKLSKSEDYLDQLLAVLHGKNIQSLIVEGGGQTLGRFIESGNWDEAYRFVGNSQLSNGISAPVIKGEITDLCKVENDLLYTIRNSSRN